MSWPYFTDDQINLLEEAMEEFARNHPGQRESEAWLIAYNKLGYARPENSPLHGRSRKFHEAKQRLESHANR